MADNVSTAFSYEVPQGMTAADYLVQGINGYFAQQRADAEKQEENINKLAQYFANKGNLRKAKSGEIGDFKSGGVNWVVDNAADAKTTAEIMKLQAETTKIMKEAYQAGFPQAKDVFNEVSDALKLDMNFVNLPAVDKAKILAAIHSASAGIEVDPTKIGLSAAGQKLWGESIAPKVSKKEGPSITEATAKAVTDAKSSLKERFKGKPASRAFGEMAGDVGKTVLGGAWNLAGATGNTLIGAATLPFPGTPSNTAFAGGLQNFWGGMTGAPVQTQAPWTAPSVPASMDRAEWDNYYRRSSQAPNFQGF